MQICTVFGILLHLFIICKSMGIERVGILSTPYAVASGGCLSLILLFTIATATFYSALLIQRCMDLDSDIGNRAFRKKKGD
ncbi:hypothetical protein V6N12_047326 [Hibiscus sabdariffa]|uniref:Amino acid transporter transmembrane domain-containing protein n=1 Tax=Hibiscus sabdariffa TaxID=183260 RepID=A0ABR2DAJ0_9ROSI